MSRDFWEDETEAVALMEQLFQKGFEKVMKHTELDALVSLGADTAQV